VIDRRWLDVVLQKVEVTVVKAPQEVAAGTQHHPPVSGALTLGEAGDERVLDEVDGLEQVDIQVLVEELAHKR
jgi:hypothetical protein